MLDPLMCLPATLQQPALPWDCGHVPPAPWLLTCLAFVPAPPHPVLPGLLPKLTCASEATGHEPPPCLCPASLQCEWPFFLFPGRVGSPVPAPGSRPVIVCHGCCAMFWGRLRWPRLVQQVGRCRFLLPHCIGLKAGCFPGMRETPECPRKWHL